MKHRAVFSAKDMQAIRHAMTAARNAGIERDDLSLIARSDISLEEIPENRKVVEGDFYPAAIKGAAGGGAAGLLAGLVAVVFAPIGITAAGVIGLGLAGASLGTWATALAGSAVPDPVRRQFESEIEAGRILLVVDVEEANLDHAVDAIVATGLVHLPFDKPSVMT